MLLRVSTMTRSRGRADRRPSLFLDLTERVDRARGWWSLPLPLALVVLIGIRDRLRQSNLFDTADGEQPSPPPPTPRVLTARTTDGSYNDLEHPAMGMAGTRFGRNVPTEVAVPETGARLLTPNPRTVSTELLVRDTFRPATTLNVLAAAWLQFQTRDWFSHGPTDPSRPLRVPRPQGDDWPEEHITVPATRRDPTAAAHEDPPRTFVNTETHWWDASQLYGSTPQFQQALRTGVEGKLIVGEDGLIPVDPADVGESGGIDGWWTGLELLHTLFMREHNAICDRLRQSYPSWTDDELFDRARLVNAALLAKIHTVEWTPGILANPVLQVGMRANWFGLASERLRRLVGRISDNEAISGIPGSPPDHHTAPYAMTEEFVAVYRMHPLIPDDYVIRSLADGSRRQDVQFLDLFGARSRELLYGGGIDDVFYSFGVAHPGALVLHNHPRFMHQLSLSQGVQLDLAAVDILRSRERGVPRYNEFRRQLHLKPAASFEEMAPDRGEAEELRRVYGGDLEAVDLTVGLFAERPPVGFGFSDTAFRVFVLMATRRLKSDRFFTTDFTPRVYTPEGMQWIEQNDMTSVLLRHHPALRPALRGVQNAFAPWQRVGD